MRKTVIAGLVALAVASVSAKPADACPYCGPFQGWCVGWDISTQFSLCTQNYNPDGSPQCSLQGENCVIWQSWLDVERLAPDGSLRAVFASIPEYRVFRGDAMHLTVEYGVVGCQSFVVSRTYEAGEALARRELAAVILV